MDDNKNEDSISHTAPNILYCDFNWISDSNLFIASFLKNYADIYHFFNGWLSEKLIQSKIRMCPWKINIKVFGWSNNLLSLRLSFYLLSNLSCLDM